MCWERVRSETNPAAEQQCLQEKETTAGLAPSTATEEVVGGQALGQEASSPRLTSGSVLTLFLHLSPHCQVTAAAM